MNHTVLKWLRDTAARLPEKAVFTDCDGSVTFGMLDRRSAAIGTALAGEVPLQTPVAVLCGRHTGTPAVFLGVARAGCFYAPMDPTMPVPRLNQILSVLNAPVLVADSQYAALVRQLSFTGRILLTEDLVDTPEDPDLLRQRAEKLLPTSPLYVIFTSGSTGTPKGVITSHQSLMHYIESFCKVLGMEESDVLGNQSPFDYIAAIRDIYIPLKTGASTVIIPKNEFSLPLQLFQTLNRFKVTALCWSVSGLVLPAKLNGFRDAKPEYLKKVCFSGSVMPGKYLKAWQQALPDVLFVNQYGPTEATASCTYYIVKEQAEDSTELPIGKPFENYGILLLREDGSEAAPGEIAEICVTGPCLALGYYADPERTAASFLQNPLNKCYRELIYKTGDLGRWRQDGELEYHGRKDRQIKHMGHRIELGEIEKTAQEISGVSECCALYHKEKELLYLFYSGSATSKEIVLHFRSNLPAFMVPRKLIPLEAFPRLPNGKLDMNVLKNQIL